MDAKNLTDEQLEAAINNTPSGATQEMLLAEKAERSAAELHDEFLAAAQARGWPLFSVTEDENQIVIARTKA